MKVAATVLRAFSSPDDNLKYTVPAVPVMRTMSPLEPRTMSPSEPQTSPSGPRVNQDDDEEEVPAELSSWTEAVDIVSESSGSRRKEHATEAVQVHTSVGDLLKIYLNRTASIRSGRRTQDRLPWIRSLVCSLARPCVSPAVARRGGAHAPSSDAYWHPRRLPDCHL